MKHINPVTARISAPKSADAVQDAFCFFIQIFSDLVGAIGGAEPVVEYLNTKCNFGVPEE